MKEWERVEGLDRETVQRWIVFPMKRKKSLRSVLPGSHELRFGSCLGELKLRPPVSSVGAPGAELEGTVGSGVLGCSSCS